MVVERERVRVRTFHGGGGVVVFVVCGVWWGRNMLSGVQMAGMSLCREKVQRMKLACGPDRKQRTYIWQLRRGVKEQAWGGQLAGYMYKCAAWLPARSSLASRKRPRPRCARTKVDDPFPACAGHAPFLDHALASAPCHHGVELMCSNSIVVWLRP